MRAPARLKTKAGHKPRARVHARWSPIGQKDRRTTLIRLLGVVLAVAMLVGLAADAYAESFLASLPSIDGLDAASLGGDAFITDRDGKLLADVAAQGDRRIYAQLNSISPKMQQATVAIRAGVPLEVRSDTIQPFPTFSEAFHFALAELGARVPAPAR